MVRRTWLLSDEEWEASEAKGRRDGELEGRIKGRIKGKREARREILSKMIGIRFPKATPAFIKKTLKPFVDSDPAALMSAVMETNSLEEFKKRVKTLIPVGV